MTVPLGGLALQDASGQSLKRAEKIVEDGIVRRAVPAGGQGPHLLRRRRRLALAGASAHGANRLSAACHAWLSVAAREALEFCELVQRVDPETLSHIEVVSAARRPLLGYAAVVLGQVIRKIQPETS